ncbi:MAG: hypothetical protein PVS3B3_24140 [Ktedonobacteraceae bacterium]
MPEELAERYEVQYMVQEALSILPPKFRAMALLRYARQLSFAEIAHVLGLPKAATKTYMHRAKPLLRARLSEQRAWSPAGFSYSEQSRKESL